MKVPQMLHRFVRVDLSESVEDARYRARGADRQPSATCSRAWRSSTTTSSVTRSEDVEIEEDETENLIKALEKELLRRRFGPPIRLEISDDMDDVTLGLLVRELDVTEQEVPPARRSTSGASSTWPGSTDRTCTTPARPRDERAAAPVRAEPLGRRLLGGVPQGRAAAPSVRVVRDERAGVPRAGRRRPRRARHQADPLPHVGRQPHRQALIDAAESGKQVLALVEIKARFDEAANITWAQAREGRRARRLRPGGIEDPAETRSSSARRRTGCATTSTSARATTTRRRAASTRTSASSRPTTRSART